MDMYNQWEKLLEEIQKPLPKPDDKLERKTYEIQTVNGIRSAKGSYFVYNFTKTFEYGECFVMEYDGGIMTTKEILEGKEPKEGKWYEIGDPAHCGGNYLHPRGWFCIPTTLQEAINEELGKDFVLADDGRIIVTRQIIGAVPLAQDQ